MITSELHEPKPSESEEQKGGDSRNNVVPLHIATGGGDSGGPWLRDLEVGTCFLGKYAQQAMLHEFWIVAVANRAVKLLAIKDDKELYMWVDPIQFSKELTCYEVIDT